jgi:hypothetical protein
MRTLLALLIALPLAAQQPVAAQQPEEKKPEAAAAPAAQPAGQAEAKPDAKPAESPAPTPAVEQTITGSVDFGYRWVSNVGGNFETYRSVVNLGEGPKLSGWDFTITDPKKRYFDRIDTQGLGWGGDPWTTARFDARKMGWYDLRFDYRNIAYFNNLPSYADPLMNVQTGFFLDENSFDIRRRVLDLQLDLRPGKRVIPFFNYTRNWNSGHGITTFETDANEYPVYSLYNDTTDTYRGGVHIEMNRYHFTLEQGGVNYGENQTVTNSSRNTGNLTTPFLGQTLFLGSLLQQYRIGGSGIFSKVLATARPASWVDLYGQFLFSQPKNDVNYNVNATGNFVNLSNLVFSNSMVNALTATAKQPHTTASAGAEIRPLRHMRVIESWTTNRLHDNSNTATLPLTSQLLVWNYSQEEVDVLYELFSKFTVRGGYRYVWGDSRVPSPNLSEAGPFEDVQLRQQVGLAGFTYRMGQKFYANFDFEGASSTHAYFRTSLYDYQRARIRARYQATGSLSVSATFSVFNNDNPQPGINYSAFARDNTISVQWAPAGGKRISLSADYDRSTYRSDISYRVPSDGTTAFDHYRDNAHTATSVVEVALPGVRGTLVPKAAFGGSLFISSGSRPSSFYQPLARVALPITKHVAWNAEWRYYGYGEQFYVYEGFRANTFFTGLRLSR